MVLRLALATALIGIAWMAPAQAQMKQKAIANSPATMAPAPAPKAAPAVGQLAGAVNVEQTAADIDSEATAGPAKQRQLKLK